jgi:hypothetical protein
MLTARDFENLLVASEPQAVMFEGVLFLLQAFDDEDKCFEAFEKYQEKRIFFISSGQMGKKVVPRILERYPRIFTDLITDRPYPSIYVFCHNIEWNLEWAMEYIEYIQMFNFDSELLERLTRDIAEYFIERYERMRQDNNLKGALQRLHWAKRLWHQYDKMQQQIPAEDFGRVVRESERMKQINLWIEQIDPAPPRILSLDQVPNDVVNDDDDDKLACETSDDLS